MERVVGGVQGGLRGWGQTCPLPPYITVGDVGLGPIEYIE